MIVDERGVGRVYLERHLANLRLGMTLELFTATGALVGGLVAFALSEQVLAGLFTVLLVYTAFTMARRRDAPLAAVATDDETPARRCVDRGSAGSADASSATTGRATPESTGPAPAPDPPPYAVRNLGRGIVGSLFAGVVSALLGIGGGLIKVPLMNLAMGVPLRVATATSNMMIGITASASAIIYLLRGGIDPYVAGPTAVGVFVGASIGSRTAQRVDVRVLRMLFVVVLLITAWQMAGGAGPVR